VLGDGEPKIAPTASPVFFSPQGFSGALVEIRACVMAVSIATAFAIYFVVWWLVLFLTLPFGVRSQHEDARAHPAPTPARRCWRGWAAS